MNRHRSLYMSNSDLAEIRVEATRLGITRSNVMVMAVRLALPTIRTCPGAPKGAG